MTSLHSGVRSAGAEELDVIAKVLVVDDLAEARKLVGHRLSQVGFAISYACDGLEALRAFERDDSDLIVTDWQMPRLDGIGLVRRIRETSDVPIMMLTAFASIPDCENAMRVGADRYLQFSRDLDRLAEVATELGRQGRGFDACGPDEQLGMTAAEARSIAQQELRAQLQELLVDCRGNIAEMARRMGKDRSTIRYHLRRLGMLEFGVSESHARLQTRRRFHDG